MLGASVIQGIGKTIIKNNPKNFHNTEYIDFVPGEFIIKFKEENILNFTEIDNNIITTGIKSVDQLNKKYSVESYEKISNSILDHHLSNVYKFTTAQNNDIIAVTKEYKNDPNIEYAEPNYNHYTCMIPNDPLFKNQWALHNTGQTGGIADADIDAPEAWNITTGSKDIVIAIIDTGLDYNHPDITDNIWINEDEIPGNHIDDDENCFVDDYIGWNFANQDNDPMDYYGHGTHCAGIAAAVSNNNIGVSGICWNSKIMPIKLPLPFNTYDIARCIIYAVKNGANVISMSFHSGSFSILLNDVANFANINDVVLVASAGNYNSNKQEFPAAYDTVISVGATNHNDEKASFSNYGSWVDIAAPGEDILSLRANNTDMYGDGEHIVEEYYYIASGTSMSCPYVAGLAALILSKYQNISPDLVRDSIIYSADRLPPSFEAGHGRVNAYEMVMRGPGPAKSEITSPSHKEIVEGTIDLIGSATGDGFQYFVVEYCKGHYNEEGNWIELVNLTTNIKDDILCSIDTNILDEGFYNIRLRVVCNNGSYKDKIIIIINNRCNTFIVDDDDGSEVDFTSIQDAILASGNCDSIYVHNGTYNENLLIDKSITLTGENKITTKICKNYSLIEDINMSLILPEINIVKVTANDVNISGFTITNDEFSVEKYTLSINGILLLYNVQNCIVSYNNICNNVTANFIGIKLEKSNNCIISHNTITFNIMGLGLYKSCNNLIKNNNIIDNTIGIRLVKMSNKNKISHNNFINKKPRFLYEHASFKNSYFNRWKGNYWDDWIGLKLKIFRFIPKRIPYKAFILPSIPYLSIPRVRCNFDWHPAKKPFDIA